MFLCNFVLKFRHLDPLMKINRLHILFLCAFLCLPVFSCQPDKVVEEEEVVLIPDEETEETEEPEEPEPIPEHQTFIITPDADGRAFIANDSLSPYLPGDTIYLKGVFTHVRIKELSGSEEKPIIVTNFPGETLIISNPTWNGGGYAQGMQVLGCRHLILGGESGASEFMIEGSTQASRGSFFCLNIREYSDNIEVRNMTILNGGMGIMAKTDPVLGSPESWHPNTTLNNLSIHDVYISGVSEEAMYIGHTAKRWGWDESGKGYNATNMEENPAHTYVEPIMWNQVAIYNNRIEDPELDGIQCSAIHGLHVYNNVVKNWGLKNNLYHSLGISVGGRATESNVHDNLLLGGTGESIQFFGEKNSSHKIHNNLIVGTQSSAIAIYDGGSPEITNNTIASIGGYAIKVNARSEQSPETVNAYHNVFIETLQLNREPWIRDFYIRRENGGLIEDRDNIKYETLQEADVDPDNYYQPNPTDTVIGKAGYRR